MARQEGNVPEGRVEEKNGLAGPEGIGFESTGNDGKGKAGMEAIGMARSRVAGKE